MVIMMRGLYNVDKSTGNFNRTKRFYSFGNFSKFIRPGYVRISATENATSGVYCTAYKDPNTGKFALVVINDNNITNNISIVTRNFNTGIITPYITDSNSNLEKRHEIVINNDKFYTELPPKSVTTFVGQLGSEPTKPENDLVDMLSDWSKTYSHTQGMVLDSSNPFYFNEDTSRARRLSEANENIVYNFSDITNFRAVIYHNKEWNGVAFYVSPDNQNWIKIDHVSTQGSYTHNGWYQKEYKALKYIPEGMNYFKVEFSGTGSWNKQLSQITISQKLEIH